MHELRTKFRNSLLFCATVANFCAFQIVKADKVINYTVPNKGAVYGNVATATGQNSWAVNSRKVHTTGYGAAASATASRSSYGFVGRMTVSRAFFQAWLAYEVGAIGLEWIKSQYPVRDGFAIDKDLNYTKPIKYINWRCESGENCWFEGLPRTEHFSNLSGAISSVIQYQLERCKDPTISCYVKEIRVDPSGAGAQVEFWINHVNGTSNRWIIQTANRAGVGKIWIDGEVTYNAKYPAGEPTLDPDPYMTAAILDRWAHIVPEMRQRVSDTVDFVPSPARYTEKDVLGNVLKDYEGVLEPIEEPIANPHKTAKRPAPEIEPTPRLKTTDLLNGNEITQPTEPIKEPTSDTATQTTPKVEVDIDLSKLEQTTASIDAKVQPLENQEINYEADNTEVETPEDLTAQEAEKAVIGRLKVPHLEPEKLVDAALLAASDFTFHDILDEKTSSCPPPRTLTIIGGAKVQMPFDPLCDFLAMIKKIFVPVVGWIIFLVWVKRIGSS